MRTLLIDSSVLIAGAVPGDGRRADAATALTAYRGRHMRVPVSILAETMGFILRRAGVHHQRVFWDAFMRSGIELVPVDQDLIGHARDIDRAYSDVGLCFADCTLLAACETLRCDTVLSFDRRLAVYKPSFARELTVLP